MAINDKKGNNSSTHKLSKTKIYMRWKGIKYRCHTETSPKYPIYGGRGIKMCDEWRNDFKSCYDWAMANGYRDDLQIDRIDVNGNYCPENCRWVDIYVQANNKRNIRRYNIDNQNLTLTEIAKKYNISFNCLRNRVRKLKWNINQAIYTPIEIGRNQFTEQNNEKCLYLNGKKISLNELCTISKLSRAVVRRRLSKGWSAFEIINVPYRCQLEKWRKENVLHLPKNINSNAIFN